MDNDILDIAQKSHFNYDDVFKTSSFTRIDSFVYDHYNKCMHNQAFYEINIITAGKGMHYIEKQRISVKKGDIFIIPPDINHGYRSIENLTVQHILIHQLFFTRYNDELTSLPDFNILFNIEPMMRADGKLNLHLKIQQHDFDDIDPLLKYLLKLSFSPKIEDIIMCNSYTLVLITKLCTLYREYHLSDFPEEKFLNDAVFMKSISYICDHYGEKINIEQLMKIAFLSRNAYIAKFKELMKVTPSNFILDYRIKKAQEFLAQSDKSLVDIAILTGFYDVSHFSKLFKKKTGYSPSIYRKEIRNKLHL